MKLNEVAILIFQSSQDYLVTYHLLLGMYHKDSCLWTLVIIDLKQQYLCLLTPSGQMKLQWSIIYGKLLQVGMSLQCSNAKHSHTYTPQIKNCTTCFASGQLELWSVPCVGMHFYDGYEVLFI